MTTQAVLDQHRPTAYEPKGPSAPSEFDWAGLVALTVHPLKVDIVEALVWLDEPLSATELTLMVEGDYDLDNVIYHARSLVELGVLEDCKRRYVRGAHARLYVLAD